ncbi:acyl-CoA-binding domain-containing protein 4 isoform X2 [Mastacembelus armatus]|uniref:Acyl-CoA binding domain containing 4 n=2 Tax=Mastacembelus armatus TaxID=205130 RepID=A0A7N8WU84_9TELE|nr:acyl-CoA-binding domain-containing protein 4 isoform X2 [Mastacembelus armatus]
MPVPAMAEAIVDHQKRFQAAVDVIHNLPKNGSYRPSYDVMLRFYSLYKQAVCGPCTVPRPSFWDPVGRYKWDAWSRLGEMSSESAMEAYVEEMKKVAQDVIDTMPMNEKTASLFHYFEPLYRVIDDMPHPPESLLTCRQGLTGIEHPDTPAEMLRNDEVQEGPKEEFSFSEVVDLCTTTIPTESEVSEGLVLTSDSESEIFCDSVDSVEQLRNIKIPVVKSSGFQNGHMSLESSLLLEARQVGAGQGGEGAEDEKGQGPIRSHRDCQREGSYHNWRDRGVPQGSPRHRALGSGGGVGRGGGDGLEGATERLYDTQLQQQIILALRRLREDMRSVMDRLEVVERLAAIHAHSLEWRPCLQCGATASQQQVKRWWLFDVSGRTVLLFLLWPFIAQGLIYLLKKAQKRGRKTP